MSRPHPYERWIVRSYLSNLMRLPAAARIARSLTSCMDNAVEALALKGLPDTDGVDLDEWLVGRALKGRWRQLARAVDDNRSAEPRPSPTASNLNLVGQLLQLDELELRILGVLVRYSVDQTTEDVVDVLRGARWPAPSVVAALLGVPRASVTRRVADKSNLGQLLMPEPMRRIGLGGLFNRVPPKLCALLTGGRKKLAELERDIAGAAPKTDLVWKDYDHVAVERDLAARLLEGALQRKELGVNLLFFGPPGTGKTALAQVLARQVGARLTAVGEADDDGDEPSRGERLAALHTASAVARRRPDTLLLFDEMDDLLERSHSFFHTPGSRVFLHRLLENNQTPTIWTANHPDRFDDALLRRMTFTVEMRVPPTAVRARVLRRVLKKHKLGATQVAVDRLARDYVVAPAAVENAARAAAIAGGDLDDARCVLDGATRLGRGRTQHVPRADDVACSLDLLRSDLDLNSLTGRLTAAKARGFSVCLSGPPGTGKSSYARHLADALGMDVMQKRTSDLISPFVGRSEQNIAAAFREAVEANVILVFDEADSLLRERSQARHSWEVTQVNEMLTWMESHPLPFVCTTNLMDAIDRAALRRFTYKVQLDYLDAVGVARAFELFFGKPCPPRALGLTVLTPGDFAVVGRRVRLEGCAGQSEAIAEMLAHECLGKRGSTRSMGFGA